MSHRREIKHPLTETACRQQLKSLMEWRDAGHNAEAAIAESIRNGWQGLFKPKAAPEQAQRDPWDVPQYDRLEAAKNRIFEEPADAR